MKSIKVVILGAAMSFAATQAIASIGWSTYSLTTGSSGRNVSPAAMAEDASGYVYVLGTAWGGSTSQNMVVMKFDPSTGSLISSQELGGVNSESGFDIKVGPDGNIYVLGLYQSTQLYTLCLSSSLSVIWQNWTTPPNTWGTSSSSTYPYRLAIGGTASTPIVYATAQIQIGNGTYFLGNDTHAKGVYFAKFNSSGSVVTSGTWAGTGNDNLRGAFPISNGLLFETYSTGGASPQMILSKIDGSTGANSWSDFLYAAVNSSEVGGQCTAVGDWIYSGFTGKDSTGLQSRESACGLNCSRTSAPGILGWNPYGYHLMTPYTSTNQSISATYGTTYWNGSQVSLGYGSYVSGSTTYYGSWIRYVGIGDNSAWIIDSSTSTSSSAQADFATPSNSYRGFDGCDGRVMGFCRETVSTSTSQFDIVSYKLVSGTPSKATDTEVFPSGYTLDTNPACQVLASKVSNSLYVMQPVTNGTDSKVGLVKVTR